MNKLVDMKSPFMAMRFDTMLKGLVLNKFKIQPKYILHMTVALILAAVTYPCTLIEEAVYEPKIKEPLMVPFSQGRILLPTMHPNRLF